MKHLNLTSKLSILILIFLFATNLFAQPDIIWHRFYGGEDHQSFYASVMMDNGDLAFAGITHNNSVYFVRTNDGGDILMETRHGSEDETKYANDLTPTDDNGFVIGGNWNYNPGRFGAIRINARGEVLWDRIYSDNDLSLCTAVIGASGDVFYLAGWDPTEDAGYQGLIVKISGNGDVIWQRHYGGEGDQFDRLHDIQAAEFGYILAGESGPRGQNNVDFWVLRISEDGEELSSDQYGNENYETVRSIVRSPDGGWVVAGFWASQLPNWNAAILKLDENRREEWFQHYENENHLLRLFDIAPARGRGFITVGWEGTNGDAMGYVARISDGGEIEWEIFDQPQERIARFSSVHVDETGLIIAVGKADVAPGNDQDSEGWVVGIRSPNEQPLVITKTPPDSLLRVARGGSQAFIIEAEDPDGDDLSYLWVLDEDTLGNENIVILDFPDLNTHYLTVSISDGEWEISTGWEITVVPLIVEWSPEDTLLQVDQHDTVEFSVRAGFPDDTLMTISWSYDEEIVSQVDTLVQVFDEIGEHQIAVEVTGQEVVETVQWLVNVTEPSDVKENSHLVVSSFLTKPTPNPFNSTTTLSYGLTTADQVGINVYDLNGQLVLKLFEGYQSAGVHTTTLSAANLPSGSYIIHLETSNDLFNQKVMLIR
ncbi:MAG: T9SS type A sorting domain-containing protein [Calditrichaeota bacterium]|nr:T9SS type A sorting domain-containing protein [Calditrichota bacterium]